MSSPDRDTSVFLNYPFDGAYESCFDALYFAVVCSGFRPRNSVSAGTKMSRIERINSAITECKYSIHDLSRSRGEGDLNYGRFNMPLELGITIGQSHARDKRSPCQYAMAGKCPSPPELEHDYLALVLADSAPGAYISDLLGHDPEQYDGTAQGLVNKVMAFLMTKEEAAGSLRPKHVLNALPLFVEKKQEFQAEWAGDVPWIDLWGAARACVPAMA